MKHAAVVHVKIAVDSDVDHRHSVLHDYVVPQVKTLSGFLHATWLNDGAGTGVCIVVFDTEEHAEKGIMSLIDPGGPPVISSAIYAVEIETAPTPG